jgi:hypothetical protein
MDVLDRTRLSVRGRPQQIGLRVAGAGLLAATGGIHLDLYLTGYRSIPTIGWLFLLQVIAAFALAVAVLVSGSRLVAAAGAGFALSTLGGYLLSVWIGLFGFKEVRTTAGIVAGLIEVAAFAVLAILAVAPAPALQPSGGACARRAAGPAAGRNRGSRMGGGWPVCRRLGAPGRRRGQRGRAGPGQCGRRDEGCADRWRERTG